MAVVWIGRVRGQRCMGNGEIEKLEATGTDEEMGARMRSSRNGKKKRCGKIQGCWRNKIQWRRWRGNKRIVGVSDGRGPGKLV